jgi:hypothetical protein
MAAMRNRVGSCHCGAVRFTAAIDPAAPAYRCNCSLCRRKGALIVPTPLDGLTVHQGWEAMSVYQWHTMVAKHYFCATCGIYTFHQRRSDPNSYGVNLGCLEGVTADDFAIEDVDGANE